MEDDLGPEIHRAMPQHVAMRLKNQLIRSPRMQQILGTFGPKGERSLWVFILGCYNSGTTLLFEIIRGNSGIASMPWEGSRLTNWFADPNLLGWPRMWHKCLPEMQSQESELGARAARQIKRQWRWASSGSDPVFVEKSITNAIRIPFLAEFFKPAFFIHIVRNGYAVSEGIQRKGNPQEDWNRERLTRYPIEMCAEQWITANNMIEQNLIGLDHIQLRYEDLCKDANAILAKISQACPVQSLSDFGLIVPDRLKVHGEHGGVVDQNHAAIGRLEPADRHTISRVAGDVLDRYGYPVLD